MKKIKLLLSLLAIASLPLRSGAQNFSTTIKVKAMDMANAFMKNDFPSFVKYMHPEIIVFAGGEENMKAKMDSAYVAMKQYGVKFKKYSFGHPSEVIKHKDQLQAVLPQSTTIITPFGELTAESSMIAISSDKGKTWWFIDTNMYNPAKLKTVLPDLSPKLVIPPRKKPKLVPLENGADQKP